MFVRRENALRGCWVVVYVGIERKNVQTFETRYIHRQSNHIRFFSCPVRRGVHIPARQRTVDHYLRKFLRYV